MPPIDYRSLLKRAPKFLRIGLKLASDIVPKLPQKDDTLLQVIIKTVAIVDSVGNILAPKSQRDGLRALLERYNLIETKNEQFVSLFFGTNLYDQFQVFRFSLNDYTEVIEASHKRFGSIFFVEYSYSTKGPEPFFYHKKGLDFSDILGGLWDSYEGRLHVTVLTGDFGESKSQYTSFKEGDKNPLYGAMQGKMDALVARHRRYAIDEVPRSYMFFGSPGTGKTSFAMAFADRIGTRILKMDAVSLSCIHVRDIIFLLENLKPDFLIVNDIDKADVSKGIPTILEVLERFKIEYPWVSVLMTANTTDRFDLGMLRPGRIDTWVKFDLPERTERQEIMVRYLERYKIEIDPPQLDNLIELTEGLSQDYLREVVLELRYDDFTHVVGNIRLRHELIATAQVAQPLGGAPTKSSGGLPKHPS